MAQEYRPDEEPTEFEKAWEELAKKATFVKMPDLHITDPFSFSSVNAWGPEWPPVPEVFEESMPPSSIVDDPGPSPEVQKVIEGMDITTIQWESTGGLPVNIKMSPTLYEKLFMPIPDVIVEVPDES